MPAELLEKAFHAAREARLNAHAPYSRFLVGAALLLEDGTVVVGCNVENSSYGATICAERNALCSCVARFGQVPARALVLVTEPRATPCGICLQVISELCPGTLPIYLCTPEALGPKHELRDFLPMPFGADKLR